MAIVSPLRARRNANRPVESTQQMIIFCLRELWFALPMAAVKRVSALQSLTDGPIKQSDNTASADDSETISINADQKIFLKARSVFKAQAQFQQPKLSETKAPEKNTPAPDRFSIVFQTSNGEAYVLVINAAPKMHRISPESIVPFSPADMSIEPMECISGVVRQAENPQTIYLLNPEQLCRSGFALS
jgi:chemotaxis signal transduction protein